MQEMYFFVLFSIHGLYIVYNLEGNLTTPFQYMEGFLSNLDKGHKMWGSRYVYLPWNIARDRSRIPFIFAMAVP